MKKIILLLILLAPAIADAQQVFPLWPADPPGDNGLTETALDDGTFHGVTRPWLELFLPEADRATGQAVVICPGGSYAGLAMGKEGRDVARWLCERGIAGIVLKYRMPGGVSRIPGDDLRRAIELTRENARLWNVDPGKVGVMGFSAGGHLASTALTHFTAPENRPDFGILVYPVISMSDRLTHVESRRNLTGATSYSPAISEYSNETRVTAQTPAVLILYSRDDDIVDVRNGTAFFDACVEAGVPAEMHIYPTGGHGWGWTETFTYSAEMKAVVARWLRGQQR